MADLQPHGPPPDLLAWILAKAMTAGAGALGALVRNLFPPRRRLRQRAAEYVGGALAAVFFGPVAGPILHQLILAFGRTMGVALEPVMPRESVDSLAAFLCGVVGLTMIEGLILLARRWRDEPRLPF